MELSTRNITEYLHQGDVSQEIFPYNWQGDGLHVHDEYDLSSYN